MTAASSSIIRPELLTMSEMELKALMPYLYMFGGICISLIVSVLKWISPKWPVVILSLLTLGFATCLSIEGIADPSISLFNNMMIFDRYSVFFNVLFFGAAILTILSSVRYLDREGLQHPEYYVLILIATLGMALMASAQDLIVLFIALELMSIVVYCLVGFRRADRRSNEAAIKYFVLGSAASAVLLYGCALIYGATGSLNIAQILTILTQNPVIFQSGVFVIGVALVLLGFLFKVAAVPFHMWMPDVYEGAPTPVTGFMTTGLKAAAFATMLRVVVSMGYGKSLSGMFDGNITNVLWVVAVATMVAGNLVALKQTQLKRILAYSSIAHTGYLLIGILSGGAGPEGYSPMLVYLVSYSIMNLGAFVVLTMIGAREDRALTLHDLSGLSSRRPALALALSIFLFSMAGIPPTAGFIAKYLLFYNAVQAGHVWLVVIGVLCSAVSVYYYLRVIVQMYMKEPLEAAPQSGTSTLGSAVVFATVALTLWVGVKPAMLMDQSKKASQIGPVQSAVAQN